MFTVGIIEAINTLTSLMVKQDTSNIWDLSSNLREELFCYY